MQPALAPTLAQYQERIAQLVAERGYDKETIPEVFTLLVEELGELAKAIRKANGQKIGTHSKEHEVAEELADVFWLTIDLANRLGVDLAAAFEHKEAINQTRTYRASVKD